jgi:flavin reductase (DIM6/NTAB) family NADH-FMN oxidoreductase RutF
MFYEPKDGHGLPHNPFKAIVAPRPIAWVSSLSGDGIANLAPYSFFNAVSDAPPMLMISSSPVPDSRGKDTLDNILTTNEFVVHIVPHAMRDAMNVTSGNYPPGDDEFIRAGLEKAPCNLVSPPRIADAPIAMECRHHVNLGLPGEGGVRGSHVIFGEVVGIHIADSALKDGLLDVTAYNPLARLGYMDYSTVRDVFSLDRPKV